MTVQDECVFSGVMLQFLQYNSGVPDVVSLSWCRNPSMLKVTPFVLVLDSLVFALFCF